jgi:hypothetical protein
MSKVIYNLFEFEIKGPETGNLWKIGRTRRRSYYKYLGNQCQGFTKKLLTVLFNRTLTVAISTYDIQLFVIKSLNIWQIACYINNINKFMKIRIKLFFSLIDKIYVKNYNIIK